MSAPQPPEAAVEAGKASLYRTGLFRTWRDADVAEVAHDVIDAALPHLHRYWLEGLAPLLRSLVDSDDCWFDHHGGCQAHGYLSLEPGEICPQRELKEVLRTIGLAEGGDGE